jgi:hypothetical protein
MKNSGDIPIEKTGHFSLVAIGVCKVSLPLVMEVPNSRNKIRMVLMRLEVKIHVETETLEFLGNSPWIEGDSE